MLYNKNKGGIFIEFALFFPILIFVFYAMLDAPRYCRWKSLLTNSAYLATSMLQSISYNRGDNICIRKVDIENVHKSIENLILRHGNINEVNKWSESEGKFITQKPKFYICMNLCCLKGTDANRAEISWEYASGKLVSGLSEGSFADKEHSWVESNGLIFNTKYDSRQIHPDLKIKKDEIKILLTLSLFPLKETAEGEVGNKNENEISDLDNYSRLLGFYFLKPKYHILGTEKKYGFFATSLIFSPNYEVFSESPPS